MCAHAVARGRQEANPSVTCKKWLWKPYAKTPDGHDEVVLEDEVEVELEEAIPESAH
jgi:hypothetical protein